MKHIKKLAALGLALALLLGTLGAAAEEAASGARRTFIDTLETFAEALMGGRAVTMDVQTLTWGDMNARYQWSDTDGQDLWVNGPDTSLYMRQDEDAVYLRDGERVTGIRAEDLGGLDLDVGAYAYVTVNGTRIPMADAFAGIQAYIQALEANLSEYVVQRRGQTSIRITGAEFVGAIFDAAKEVAGSEAFAAALGEEAIARLNELDLTTIEGFDEVAGMLLTLDIVTDSIARGEVTSINGTLYAEGSMIGLMMDIETTRTQDGDRVTTWNGTLSSETGDVAAFDGQYSANTGEFYCTAWNEPAYTGYDGYDGYADPAGYGVTHVEGRVTGNTFSIKVSDDNGALLTYSSSQALGGTTIICNYTDGESLFTVNVQSLDDRFTLNARAVSDGEETSLDVDLRRTRTGPVINVNYNGGDYKARIHYADGVLTLVDDETSLTATFSADERRVSVDIKMKDNTGAEADATLALEIDPDAEQPTLTGTLTSSGLTLGKVVIAGAEPIPSETIDQSQVIWITPEQAQEAAEGLVPGFEEPDEPAEPAEPDEPAEPAATEPPVSSDQQAANDIMNVLAGRAESGATGHTTSAVQSGDDQTDGDAGTGDDTQTDTPAADPGRTAAYPDDAGEKAPSLAGMWVNDADQSMYVFGSNGTGLRTVGGVEMHFTYEIEGSELRILFDGNQYPFVTTFELEGDTMRMLNSLGSTETYTRAN